MTNEELAKTAMQFIQVGYRVLAERVLTMIALLFGIGLWYMAMNKADLIPLGIAAAYSVLVILPLLRHEKK